MKVVDLFSGLEGWSAAFRERGHEVITYDKDKKFNPSVSIDLIEVDELPEADVYLVSPPCNRFSVATLYRNWIKMGDTVMPKNKETVEAVRLVYHTLWLIQKANPRFWVLENPRAMLRNVIGSPVATVSYCQYGERWMKPTDLWGVFPKSLVFKPMCSPGDSCHESASRSENRGIQGVGGGGCSAERAKVPYELSKAFCLACERPEPVKLEAWL